MLTEQEREWLERRKNPGHINKWRYPCANPLTYDRLADFIDAARFEALVAVKLAQNEYMFIPCYLSGTKWNDCPHEDWDFNQCRIKYAASPLNRRWTMLTESEKDWLDRRKKNEKDYGSVFCPYCDQFIAERDEYIGHCYDDLYCPLTDHFIPDAAEFEARVAEKLARNICYNCSDEPEGCPSAFEYPRRTGERCRLMHARIAVESEMGK